MSIRSRGRRVVLGLATAAAAWGAIVPAMAQDKWPSKAVNVIVPYPAGGLADMVARPLAAVLEKNLKQSFVIVNKPGATGGIGATFVAQSPPDGYTMMVTLIGMSTIPVQAVATGKTPPYTREQFIPMARLVSDPSAIFVQKSAPWNTFQELIADAKKRPNEIIFISTGPYGPTHLPMEMLMDKTGTTFRHLPTTGGAPATTMLLSGGGHVFFAIPALGAQHVEAGTLKVLGTSSSTRLPEFPNAPTMKELGIDLFYATWSGVFLPKGVPDDIVKAMDEAISKAVQDPDVANAYKKQGTALSYLNAADFRKFWDEDTARLEPIVKMIAEKEKDKKN